ncbi:hypothetical protein QTP70_022064 [Hemibagrus guttatus]|uniref:RING-type E3 ubiquitin transferase n=1 Tax=Hemibagrus guttatus TaxID=175788 RepID=A0AAE0V7Q9_9TELE|nr:hypothetical protein QTP70_022064 [Hemibagrus guttatus]
MPVAVMLGEHYEKLLEQCETQELEAPGGIATPQVYAQLLALYLLHNDMNNARYLWKRIPQAIKTVIVMLEGNPRTVSYMDSRTVYLAARFPRHLQCDCCPSVVRTNSSCNGISKRFSGGVFRCPTCRFEVVLDRHGVHGLQRNILVENIIDLYKQQQEGCGTTAVPVKPMVSTEPLCEEHKDEKINIYCVTHQIPTCSLCKVFGEHKDCEVSPIASVYQAQKGEMSNAIDALVASNGRLQALLNQMEEACKAVQDNAQRAKQKLGERFDALYVALEERKNALLERISKEQDDKVAVLRKLARRYGDRLQACTELTDTAVQALEQSSAADFLQSSKGLIAQTKDAAKTSLAEERPEAGFERMDHFTLFTDHIEALLSKMDFGSTRRRAYGLVAQAYTSINAEDFASFVGYSVEEAVKDPPPVSLVPNEQQLARLTDYVAFLEN